MLQSLFGVLGSAITTLMTGQLGDVPLAALGLANQLYYILSLAQFGIASGASIFTAQYWGKKDHSNISKVLGVSFIVCLITSLLFAAVAIFIPQLFLGIFTTDEQVINLGVELLRIIGWSFFFTPITNTCYMILRSINNVRLPMVISFMGVALNIIFGYALIFGKLGAPALGVHGAAYANLIARVMECLLILFMVYYLKTPLAAKPSEMFVFDRLFLKKTLSKILPVTVNELLWSTGVSAYSAIYAHINTESIAAINIKLTIEDLVFVPFLGIIHACSIMVGNAIGAGDQEKSYDYIRQSERIILVLAVIVGGALVIGSDFITSLYNISDLAAFYTRNVLIVLGSILWLRTSNTLYFLAMMRSGGDTRFAYWMDVGSMWFIGVPCAWVAAFVFNLPVYYVFLIVTVEEVVKIVLSIWRFRSNRWIHNLVES